MPVNISGNGSITGLTDLAEPTEINSGSNDLVLKAHGAESLKCTSTENIFDKKINVNGDVQMASLNSGQFAGFRNKIINGAMQVAQRGVQETGVTTAGYYTCDRWNASVSGLGTWTVDQSTDAPNGFSNSLKLTCTTADASPAANDRIWVDYNMEGQNLQDLQFGSAGAKEITASFWVKSNKTGTATVNLFQPDNTNKQYSTSYTINASNTWEYKTITVPGDTAGSIDNDNGLGLQLEWVLNSGSTYTGGSGSSSWGSFDNANRNFANLGVGGAVSDYFAITGVQLEVSPVATPFEHRPYGTEFALCQRYFQKYESVEFIGLPMNGRGTGSSTVDALYQLRTPMRTTPTGTYTGALSGFRATRVDTAANLTPTAVVVSGLNVAPYQYVKIAGTVSSITAGQACVMTSTTNGGNFAFEVDAEL